MSLDHINLKKIRKSFGKIPLVTSLPNLVEVQKRSFDSFLQLKLILKKEKILVFIQFLNLYFQYMIIQKEQQ